MKNNWQIKKLGEVCLFENGDRGENYPSKSVQTTFGIPFINAGHLFEEGIDFKNMNFISRERFDLLGSGKIHKGDILFCLRGSLGKVASVGDVQEGAIASSLVIVRPKKELLDKYLLLYFKSGLCTETINHFRNGAAQPNLSAQSLKKFMIPIPPLSEQKRVVNILDNIFEKIEKAKANAEKNLQNSKELFKGYLNSVFTSFHKDWEKKKVGDIGKVSMCKRVFKEQTTRLGDIPFYKIGTFGKKPDAFISNEIYNEFLAKFPYPKKGDILISASGTIGRRVKYDGEPAYFQDSNIVWIDNNEKQLLNDYLYYFYGACDWNLTKGATISRLYNDNLRQIQISFPKSFEEQQEIVKKLDELSEQTGKLESIYKQKLADLEELKKSVLQKAFNGEL